MSEMVINNQGGTVYTPTEINLLKRFLMLGKPSGTYYVGRSTHVKEFKNVVECAIKSDGMLSVDIIADISLSGRCVSNEQSVFALSMAAGSKDHSISRYALSKLPVVCRTAEHLFSFCEHGKEHWKWTNRVKKAVGEWYTAKKIQDLEYQVLKYRNRNGWVHRDVLRKAHVRPPNTDYNNLFKWAVSFASGKDVEAPSERILAFLDLQTASKPSEVVDLIREHRFTWEMIPTAFLGKAEVWEALLEELPVRAMLRNLGRMSSLGVLSNNSWGENKIVSLLKDTERLKNARIHPVTLMFIKSIYTGGKGEKGGLRWNTSEKILNALEEAFFKSFEYVEPSGKNLMVCLDVSSSMESHQVSHGLTCRDISAAMSLAIRKSGENVRFMAFSHEFIPFEVGDGEKLMDIIRKMKRTPFGGTNCSIPMEYAIEEKIDNIDGFIIFTDNETSSHCGRRSPANQLKLYRKMFGRGKLIVCSMVSNGFTIADPDDPDMLDICGFDPNVPAVISNFAMI